MKMELSAIGTVHQNHAEGYIQLDEAYQEALTGLDGFSHLAILWWCHECDIPEARKMLTVPKPYQKAPETLGVFATRSPARPNPIALTNVPVREIDLERGRIYLYYMDAIDGTPVLDIKPYTPSSDRIEQPAVPAWCSHWPPCFEESGDFAWEEEFLF